MLCMAISWLNWDNASLCLRSNEFPGATDANANMRYCLCIEKFLCHEYLACGQQGRCQYFMDRLLIFISWLAGIPADLESFTA